MPRLVCSTAYLMGHNFGLLRSAEEGRRLLTRLHRVTTRRGRITAKTRDPYDTPEADHLEYHKLNRRRGRLGGQLRLRVRVKKHGSPWFG